MTLSQKQIEFAWMVCQLLMYAHRARIPVKVLEWYRTKQRQLALVAAGLSWTKWGKHPKGLAVDLAIIRNKVYIKAWKEYEPLGLFWERIGGTWGGRWKGKKCDPGHFEYKEG